MKRIFPSVIHETVTTIGTQLALLDRHCPGYHIDLMDGSFVANTAGSVALANQIATMSSTTTQWVHLMVNDPLLYVSALAVAPGSLISFHIETNVNISKTVAAIKEKKWHASLAINPKTAPEKIFAYAREIDQVLVMSVEPGFAGQDFLPESLDKIKLIAAYRATAGLSLRIGVDGGVTMTNCVQLAQAGVDDFAVASAVFSASDPVAALMHLNQLVAQ